MIKVTDKNRDSIIKNYANRLLDDMDFDTLYNLAYDMLVENKSGYNNRTLESEILEYYPDVLET